MCGLSCSTGRNRDDGSKFRCGGALLPCCICIQTVRAVFKGRQPKAIQFLLITLVNGFSEATYPIKLQGTELKYNLNSYFKYLLDFVINLTHTKIIFLRIKGKTGPPASPARIESKSKSEK